MWFRLGFQNFISKTITSNGYCDLFVSDLRRIWHKSLSDDELLSISQKLNPMFEASPIKLKEIILNLFEDEKVQKEIKEENQSLVLKLESNKMGLRFQFVVTLEQGDGEMLYKELTVPLLLTIASGQNREKRLIKIIKDKDAELHEYHQECVALKSSYLTTKPFSEIEFDSQESTNSQLAEIISNPGAVLDCIHKKLCCIEELPKTKPEQPLKVVEHHLNADKKCDIKDSIFKEKNVGHSSNVNPCVKPNHKIIKRRKKNNELFKF